MESNETIQSFPKYLFHRSSKNSESRWKINAKRERERERERERDTNGQWIDSEARVVCTRDTVEVTTSYGLLARHVLPTFTRVTLTCASASFRVSARRSTRTRGFGRPILLRMIYMRSRNASWPRTGQLLSLRKRSRSSPWFTAPTLRTVWRFETCSFVRFLGGSLLSRWIGFPTRGRRIGDKMVWSGLKWFKDGEKRLNVCRGVNHKTEWIFKDEICDRGVILFNVDCFKRDRNFVGFFFFYCYYWNFRSSNILI